MAYRSKARSARIKFRCSACARILRILPCSKSGCAAIVPRSFSTKTGAWCPSLPISLPAVPAAWERTRTPMAGCSFAIWRCPIFATTRSRCRNQGAIEAESTRALGAFLRDIMRLNPDRFRVVCPDETTSNRLDALFEVTERCSVAQILPEDDHVSPNGRVMEVLSENLCQGWLEGYLLTGRHGIFPCYEAFIHIVDSMVNQHAKWLKTARQVPWRRPIASLTYLLTSHVWRQDNNGFSHQDPGFIDHVVNKKADVVRVYLAAGRKHIALRRRSLPTQPQLH